MAVSFRPASPADGALLLAQVAALYQHEGIPFDEPRHRAALAVLLADATLGRAFLVRADGDEPAGYAVLTYGYSVEFGGRFALLDEIYLAPAWRGQGIGQRLVEHLAALCSAEGFRALRLEVERANAAARAAYLRWGFAAHDRDLMTRPL